METEFIRYLSVSYAGLRGTGNGGGARGRGWEGFAGQVMAAPLFAVVDFT
jgi:hypothetical protein